MKRVSWIDNAKAIAIFLVVLGHYAGLNSHVKTVIYSFHLPLFMIISGLLLKDNFYQIRFSLFFNKQLRSFISLYVFFSIVSILFWFLINDLSTQHVITAIKAMVYGTHGADKLYLHDNGALWYFPFLITSLLLFYCVMQTGTWGALILSSVYFFVSYYYSGLRLPWSLDVAGVGVLSLLIGFYFKNISQTVLLQLNRNKNALLLLMGVTSIAFITLSSVNGITNINKNLFGESIVFYLVNILLGSFLIFCLSIYIPKNKLSEFISNNTLVIFAIHLLLVKLLRFLTEINNTLLKHFLIFCSAVLITLICAVLGRFLMPWIKRNIMFNPKIKE